MERRRRPGADEGIGGDGEGNGLGLRSWTAVLDCIGGRWRRQRYDEYITVLAEEMESYTRPTVFLHGDTHRFLVDQPLFSAKNNRRFENFTRVETFGSPDTHWIKVTVDPADAQVFSFKAEIVAENVRARR
jgi:hypothetical protein